MKSIPHNMNALNTMLPDYIIDKEQVQVQVQC